MFVLYTRRLFSKQLRDASSLEQCLPCSWKKGRLGPQQWVYISVPTWRCSDTGQLITCLACIPPLTTPAKRNDKPAMNPATFTLTNKTILTQLNPTHIARLASLLYLEPGIKLTTAWLSDQHHLTTDFLYDQLLRTRLTSKTLQRLLPRGINNALYPSLACPGHSLLDPSVLNELARLLRVEVGGRNDARRAFVKFHEENLGKHAEVQTIVERVRWVVDTLGEVACLWLDESTWEREFGEGSHYAATPRCTALGTVPRKWPRVGSQCCPGCVLAAVGGAEKDVLACLRASLLERLEAEGGERGLLCLVEGWVGKRELEGDGIEKESDELKEVLRGVRMRMG